MRWTLGGSGRFCALMQFEYEISGYGGRVLAENPPFIRDAVIWRFGHGRGARYTYVAGR